MARPKAQLRLGAFFNPTGHHVASWRHPTAQADAGINFKHYVEIAQTAERAKFDMIFLADNVCVREAKLEALSRSAQYIANFEPITLISALAGVTERIGLTCTASTSYNEPFHVARKFASLDHISGGMMLKPRTLKCLPLWLSVCSFDGSNIKPLALSRTKASSSQLSHNEVTISANSLARS
jgi:hypothetical protein